MLSMCRCNINIMDSDQSPKRWPGQVDETYPEVFTTIPPQPAVLKPGQFSPKQVKQFFEEVRCSCGAGNEIGRRSCVCTCRTAMMMPTTMVTMVMRKNKSD